MGNRTMEQKRVKMRKRKGRQRRFGKQFMSTGRGPNVEVLAEYSARGHSVVDPYWEAIFPAKQYTPEELMARGRISNDGWLKTNSVPRGEVIRKCKELLEALPSELHIKLQRGKVAIDLFFPSTKEYAFFIERNSVMGTIRKSIHYGSVERAKTVWKMSKIKWVEVISLSSPLA